MSDPAVETPPAPTHTPMAPTNLRGTAAENAERWKDKKNPLPYNPADMLSENLQILRESRERTHLPVSKHMLNHYVAYRMDPATDKLSQRARAAAIGCSVATISKLEHIPEVYDEIRRARNFLNKEGLLKVDDAVLTKAIEGGSGSTDAARLYYERWDPEYMPKKANVNVNAEINQLASKSPAELEAMAAEMLENIRQIRARVDAVAPTPKPVIDAEIVQPAPTEPTNEEQSDGTRG